MDGYVKEVIEYLTKTIWEAGHGDFWGAIMAAILLALVGFFRKRFKFLVSIFGRYSDSQINIPKALRHYRETLEKETLKLNHSWRLEEQTLEDLIVPVNIYEKGKNKRTSLKEFVKKKYKSDQNSRLLIVGNAGSGKSVAMASIAREVWDVKRTVPFLPVLLTFSEIKHIRTEKDFRKVIIQNLERFQFEQGQKNNKAEKYIDDNLYKGNILLLLDGFDEVEKQARYDVAGFLNRFFQTNPNIPFVLSSRTAVWEQNPNLLSNNFFDKVSIADFSPFEVRQFISNWSFEGKKSSEKLNEIINDKIYLRNIATNPLMLTIIAFVYSQPKRILPDNRVKFYYECIEALMEKWDNTKSIIRANQFETIDKVAILSRLAFEQIINEETTGQDISKETAMKLIKEEMRRLSRPIEKREQMLHEIVYNAEMLIELPPDAYKFPHRTFMEYLAAKYVSTEVNHDLLLENYAKDKAKWQETLALYCGINENLRISEDILNTLKVNFMKSQSEGELDTFVFNALVESARVSPALANEILDLAENYLTKAIDQDIIKSLGYIAVNPSWAHRKKAKRILLKQLSKELTDDEFQQVVFSLVSISDAKIQEEIFNSLNRIDLIKFLTKAGSNAEKFAIRLIEIISPDRWGEVFEGLKEAGELELLFSLMMKSTKKEIQELAAFQLALSSQSEAFFNFIELTSIKDLNPKDKSIVESKFKKYGWSKPKPTNLAGQQAIIAVAYFASKFLGCEHQRKSSYEKATQINNWLKFLISAFLHEDGFTFSKYNLFNIPIKATTTGLLGYWKSKPLIDKISVSRVLLYLYLSSVTICFFTLENSYTLLLLFLIILIQVLVIFTFGVLDILGNIEVSSKKEQLLLNTLNFFPPIFYLNIKNVYDPLIHLWFGAVHCILFYLLPLPFYLQTLTISIMVIQTLFGTLTSYINLSGKVIQDFGLYRSFNLFDTKDKT